MLDPSGQASPAERPPCRTAGAGFTAARVLGRGRQLRLFNTAKAKGVAIFFISTRREDQRHATVNNLKAAGYDGWADLALKQPDDKSSSQEFKTARRKEIEDAGFTIIANVGDQYSDLRGGHAERVFKVPNPFYFIP